MPEEVKRLTSLCAAIVEVVPRTECELTRLAGAIHVGRLEGVEGVSVSLAPGEVLVTYRPELVGPQRIVDTLRAVGYSVRDPRNLDAYEEEAVEVRGDRDRFQAGLALTVATVGLMAFKWASGHPLSATIAGRPFS